MEKNERRRTIDKLLSWWKQKPQEVSDGKLSAWMTKKVAQNTVACMQK
jgi:hypothetical protein